MATLAQSLPAGHSVALPLASQGLFVVLQARPHSHPPKLSLCTSSLLYWLVNLLTHRCSGMALTYLLALNFSPALYSGNLLSFFHNSAMDFYIHNKLEQNNDTKSYALKSSVSCTSSHYQYRRNKLLSRYFHGKVL